MTGMPSRRMRTSGAIIITIALALAGSASGGIVTYTDTEFDDRRTGFGETLNMLSIQSFGTEWGEVRRSGGEDVLFGDATARSRTITAGEILGAGIRPDHFGLVFNINEPESSPGVILRDFTLLFYDSSDNLMFTAAFHGTIVLQPFYEVHSERAGWLFDIDLTREETDRFFSNPRNRIGMEIGSNFAIINTFGDPENFYIVPAPGVLALLGAGVLAGARRRRR